MTVFHDEVEIEDFEYDEETEIYHYPCPCGDRFEITKVNEGLIFFVRSHMLYLAMYFFKTIMKDMNRA